MQRSLVIAPVAVLLLSMTACQDAGITAPLGQPPETGAPQLSEQLSLDDLRQSASLAAVRVEVELAADSTPLVAREVERADADEVDDPETVEGRVAAADEEGVTLVLGDLRVDFDEDTRFLDEEGDTLTRANFLARLEEALEAGGDLAVEARRPAPEAPQAPEDGSFVASELEIVDGDSEPRLELNIDADNLELATGPATGARLKVLGLTIEIRARETRVERGGREEARGLGKIEGRVAGADTLAGAFTLANGTRVRLDAATVVDAAGDLTTLRAVAQALAAGSVVVVRGEGALESAPPARVVLASRVRFEAKGKPEGGKGKKAAAEVKLDAPVASVDVAARTLTLGDGRVVRLTDDTKLQGSVRTLQRVAEALAAGRTVRVEGRAAVESQGPPVTLVAGQLKLRVG